MGDGGPDAGRGVSLALGAAIREVAPPGEGPVEMESHAPVHAHLRGPGDRVRTGALLGLIDNVGGLCGGLGALPDGWVVSTNLMVRRVDAESPPAGRLTLRSRVLRRGRSAVVTAIDVEDATTRAQVADAVLTSSILVPEHGVPDWVRPVVLQPGPLPSGLPPLAEWAGIEPDGIDAVALSVRDELRNPWGILHGGMVALLVDSAAEREASSAGSKEPIVTDVALHFLAPARLGPVRARAHTVGTRPDGRTARVEVRDAGAEDRVVAVAVTTTRAS